MKQVVTPCRLQGAYIITPPVSSDARGIFSKLFERDHYLQDNLPLAIQEVFFSTSAKHVIRGIHFQTNRPQTKLVCVLRGAVRDVIVDLRFGSPSFGQWESVLLSAENGHALYIPAGFGHGFLSLADDTTMLYMCEGKYDRETDTGIRYDDPDLAIDWGLPGDVPVVSARDLGLMSFREYRTR